MKNIIRFTRVFRFFTIISVLFHVVGTVSNVCADDIRLPKGTQITLQLNDALSTASNVEGDEFTAAVITPVYLGDQIVIPKGSVVTGSVSRILRPDRLKGKAVLDIIFQSIRVQGYKPADIAATLNRIDPAGSGGTQTVENFTEREKPAGGAARPGNSGSPKISVRAQVAGEKNIGAGTSGGPPSVFNSQGDDAKIPRGASLDITLDRPLTLYQQQ